MAREPSGRVAFVPRAAPGDLVRVEIAEERASYARARILDVVEPGPGRRPAPCPYYRGCGGCQLQHLEPGSQREAKREIVRDALERIGRLEVEVPPLEAPGPEFGYRNRVTFTLRREAERVTAGYHRFDRAAELLDVEDCPLAEPAIREAWRALRAGWGEDAEALPSGPELRITLQASAAGSLALIVEGGDGRRPGRPDRVAAALPRLAAYHWRDAKGDRRRLAGGEVLEDEWSGLSLRLRPEAFLQVNRTVSEAMDRHLERGLAPRPGSRLLDLYAGVALRGIRWSREGAEVVACDVNEDAVRTAREAAKRHAPQLRILRGRVEERLDALLPADAAVVNPPRAGLGRAVTRRLAAGGLGRLAYVSCDPATLARDLARLAPAWSVDAVRAFDAFPQTAHVETITWLRPRAGGAA